MLFIEFIAFIITGDLILRTFLWFGLGKIFKIKNVTLKKAFQACLLFIGLYIVVAIILSFIVNIPLARAIISLASIFIGICILKVIFKTTILKSMAIIIPSLLIIGCFSLIIKIYVVEAFKVSTGSLKPTILNDERILINKLGYSSADPVPGDMIVFTGPEDPANLFLKRVVGIEGDKIEIKNGVLFVNDNKARMKKVGTYKDDYIEDAEEYIESLGKTRYHILDQMHFYDNFGPVTVPENSLFVLGDNRDNSMDSRHLGFIDKSTVKGKAEIIYWSKTPDRFDIRWGRIGNSL